MNCRTMRGLGATAAMMLVGGLMLLPSAQAQMGSADKAKSKAMDSMSARPPAMVYGNLMKQMSVEIIGAAEAMPADKYDFAPTAGKFDGVRTFGSQVQHLVGANYMFFSGFGLSGGMDEAKVKSLKSKDELVAALKESFAFAQKGIDTITPQNAFEVTGSGEMKMTRAGAASFCMAHAMDHYGQMVEYLRMNGIVPPASQRQGM